MQKNNTVSVVMSTYNGEKYILDQLKSLKNQSNCVDEVLIIDDCSKDATVEMARRYISSYNLNSKWKIIQNKINQGWKHNFMFGAQQAKGDLVFFSDQDDVWFQNKIEIYDQIFSENDNINVLASHETEWMGESSSVMLSITSNSYDLIPFNNKNYLIQCSGCTMAVRKKYLMHVLPFYKDGWAHDDFLWKMSTLDDSFALLNSSTILHRIHENNESRKKRDKGSTLKGINLEKNITNSLLSRLNEDTTIDKINLKKRIVYHKQRGNLKREKFFESKNLLYVFQILINYMDIYRRKRQLIGDILLLNK